MSTKFTTAIVGANGYTGRELARLLLNHPHAELIATLGRDSSWTLGQELPETSAKKVNHYSLNQLTKIATEVDTLFFATPHEVTLQNLPQLMDLDCKIIDLSGGLRVSKEDFAKWYGEEHTQPAFLEHAVYGLSPWWPQLTSPETCKLLSNPGCYATCAQMALLPLLLNNIINPSRIIIDAKSGLTGAGRQAKENLLFCEMHQDFYAYKIGAHQHIPEIQTYLKHFSQLAKDSTTLTALNNPFSQLILNTHVLPLKRGISMSIYTELNPHLAGLKSSQLSNNLLEVFNKAYEHYALVRYADLSQQKTDNHKKLLSLSHVVGSARIHIAWQQYQNNLMIFAQIDNLMKGAASQAIENFNWMHNLPCHTALQHLEGIL